MATHNRNHTGFKTRTSITKPLHSEELAEFMGILVGDGHLSKYQVSVTTNAKTDRRHALFIKKLTERLFKLKATLTYRDDENSVAIVASSRTLVEFLHRQGMPVGNKIKNRLAMPPWVQKTRLYREAFLRGLFDTDGCIYLDTHRINGTFYGHLSWTITSYADTLTTGVLETLRTLGYTPTHRVSQRSIYLRRQKEIRRYFATTGTHNPKHAKRYQIFLGRVRRMVRHRSRKPGPRKGFVGSSPTPSA